MLDLLHYYIDNNVKVRDHCHITGKCRGSVHRNCSISLKVKSQNSYFTTTL